MKNKLIFVFLGVVFFVIPLNAAWIDGTSHISAKEWKNLQDVHREYVEKTGSREVITEKNAKIFLRDTIKVYVSNLHKKCESLELSNNTLELENSQLESRKTALEQEKKNLESEIKKLNSKVEELNAQNNKLKELSIAKNSLTQSNEVLKLEIDKLNYKVNYLEGLNKDFAKGNSTEQNSLWFWIVATIVVFIVVLATTFWAVKKLKVQKKLSLMIQNLLDVWVSRSL